MKRALIIIETQRCFLDGFPDPAEPSEYCEDINRVAAVFRRGVVSRRPDRGRHVSEDRHPVARAMVEIMVRKP